ncbi:Fic family protein [Oscillospiraceae bacterium MB24-C1]|nr:Fic family protein [Oscillospiraceae bacterium MB24-C1]
MSDPYLYPGSEILKNKQNVRDQELLNDIEANFVGLRIKSLMENPMDGDYDFAHLCKIHHWIFQDVFEWAGMPRIINIEKPELALSGLSVEYSDYRDIQSDAQRVLDNMRSVKWYELDDKSMANEFSKHMAQLWRTHGFREGNTRTVVTFCCLFARSNKIPLEPALFEKHSTYVRSALVAASAIFKDLGDRSNLCYLKKIVLDSMIQAREKERPKTIKDKLVVAQIEADRFNAKRMTERDIADSNKYDRGR